MATTKCILKFSYIYNFYQHTVFTNVYKPFLFQKAIISDWNLKMFLFQHTYIENYYSRITQWNRFKLTVAVSALLICLLPEVVKQMLK